MSHAHNYKVLTPGSDMSDTYNEIGDDQSASVFGDDVYVKIIDKLRELGIAEMISLPQLVVVGDQSSGKSSVLESLTGFAFPRAPGLCTRYVTQITCRRDDFAGTDISIIPGPHSTVKRIQEVGCFKRSLKPGDLNLAEVFLEANVMMGIRQGDGFADDEDDADLNTFSEDILKIEISGPQQQHLTVIDVPGIFRTVTEGLTTEEDIELVRNMVNKYIKDPRTIILAVIPCNQDIATQEILKLAKEVDPEGIRTMGVLTKPDLVPERAMQQMVCGLVQGQRQSLRLGYFVVKNRGSDDENWSRAKRDNEEIKFFSKKPWAGLPAEKVGTAALAKALGGLLRSITKKEFKNVSTEIRKLLDDSIKENQGLGQARCDAASQRQYLGKISTDFQEIARCARQADYVRKMFSNNGDMRLVTVIRQLNDDFKDRCWSSGHTWEFEGSEGIEADPEESTDEEWFPDLGGILKHLDFECPDPQGEEALMLHIEDLYRTSRGAELGTFNPHILSAVFREQSSKWEPLVIRHTSRAIVAVHKFLMKTLDELCTDETVREQIWSLLLQDRLNTAYERAMAHAIFLLEVERDEIPVTVDDSFEDDLRGHRSRRLEKAIDPDKFGFKSLTPATMINISKQTLLDSIENRCDIHKEIHDVLRSYYSVALGHIIDAVCQQVVFHFLLNGKGSPLSIFCPELIMSLSDVQLAAVASEDALVQEKRERLGREIDKLRKAVDELRFAV